MHGKKNSGVVRLRPNVPVASCGVGLVFNASPMAIRRPRGSVSKLSLVELPVTPCNTVKRQPCRRGCTTYDRLILYKSNY